MVQRARSNSSVLGIGDKTARSRLASADLILVHTSDVNIAAVGDPYDALVGLAQPANANVDTVTVDGRILRRDNKYSAFDHRELIAVGMESAAKLHERTNWPA